MLEVRDLHAYYGKSHILQGVDLAIGEGRDREPAGPQRRRPLDHLQGDHGPGAAGRRRALQGHADLWPRPDQIAHAGLGLRAGGPPDLPRPDRAGRISSSG
jgi:branched-chain amino acid transport system ATP-binding protein